MASPVRVMVANRPGSRLDPSEVCAEALGVFHSVESECSRFDPASDLSKVNGAPERWHRVGRYCYLALEEAWQAYRWSSGRFDPRVLVDLVALGYDHWPPRDNEANASDGSGPAIARPSRAPWRPRFIAETSTVHVDGSPVDLGGIGKGLAVRWASWALKQSDHLVEAGGDCYCAGTAPGGQPWHVGVEDPAGGDTPLAVLAVGDRACTTSSIRRRRWVSGGERVHHLIDPSVGRPGGTGLLAVTVIGADPAVSEVWSKVLFLSGALQIEKEAERHHVAACWVTDDNVLHVNEHANPFLLWRR